MVRLDTDPLQMRTLFLPWVKNVCVCTSLVCSGGHQSWRLPPWSHPCRTTSVRRRQKTSTCHRSRSPCVVVEKVSTCQRENGDGGVDKKNVKSRQTLHKNSSDLLAGYSNNTLKFWWHISDKKLKYKWRIAAARPTYYFVGIIFLWIMSLKKN